jgi:TonB family protein
MASRAPVETEENQASGRRARKERTFIILGILLLVVGIGFVVQNLMNGKTNTKKMVATIKLLPDTPPPPPPPPPKEPPKEQPKEMKVVQPMPQEAPPQPSEELKMEGPAGDAPSQFGAGKVTTEGGMIGGNSRFKGYLGGLQKIIRDELSRNDKLRKGEYKAVVAIWLNRNGSVDHFEMLGSSGEPDIDAAMKKVLSAIKQFDEPPSDMPQPVKLRISSR